MAGVKDVKAADPVFNEVIHSPLRLRICGILHTAGEVQFSAIRETLGVSDAVCSKHVKVLADKGYVLVSKRQGGRTAHDVTWVELTDEGVAAFESHLAALRQIASGVMPGMN